MGKMKLGSKIVFGFVLVLTVMLVVGVIAVFSMVRQGNRSRVLADEFVPQVEVAGNLAQGYFQDHV